MNTINGFAGMDAAFKTYFTPHRVMRFTFDPGSGSPSWVARIHEPAPPPPEIAVPIAAIMAVSALGWIIARRNALAVREEAGLREEAGPSFYRAVADWFAMLIARLFNGGNDGRSGRPSGADTLRIG